MITTPVKHDELCDRRALRVQLVKNGLRCESLGTPFELPAGSYLSHVGSRAFLPRALTHLQSLHSPSKLGRLQS